MEDRYEIRGKIGQGGLGAVYRGFDLRMNREVAIKRISTAGDDPSLREESTQQLAKEAGALASLQHPNIVTIHDVGSDEEGPYVVMELIEGKTLDELIEQAPLTWPDFKELVLQTQEALIAAQERNLIHSDLKPSNLMLTWLPSGKFQIKIVDFGLASLARSQSKESLQSLDVVFGSIFFMPPEQFERHPLDMRSDMYSIGCVYYQALTGRYPFDGSTGNEVMEAHLQHKVIPIKDIRAGIPLWANDWIMWHLNRYPQDRPESARDALSLFLQNDRVPQPAMTTGIPHTPAGPPKAKVRLPGETTSHAPAPAEPPPPTQTTSTHLLAKTAPQPLRPPEGYKPSVHTSPVEIAGEFQGPQAQTGPLHSQQARHHNRPPIESPPAKKAGKGPKIAIAVISVVIAAALAGLLMKIQKVRAQTKIVGNLITQSEHSSAAEIPLSGKDLQIVLKSISTINSESQVQRICAALAKAKSSDATDIDKVLANFVSQNKNLPPSTRDLVISETLRPRSNPVILPAMLEIASTSDDPQLTVAALQSIRPLMRDEHMEPMLRLLIATTQNPVRDAAEANIAEILKKSTNPKAVAAPLNDAKNSAYKPETRQSLKRLTSFVDSLPARPR